MEAYLGEEGSGDLAVNWKDLVRPCVEDLVHQTIVFCHFFHMLLSAKDLRALFPSFTDPLGSEISSEPQGVIPSEGEAVREIWSISIDGRNGLFHALASLQLNQMHEKRGEEWIKRRFSDPIIKTVTLFAVVVLKTWALFAKHNCDESSGLASSASLRVSAPLDESATRTPAAPEQAAMASLARFLLRVWRQTVWPR